MREPARFRVVRPGLLTTVQDLGRFGCQRYGVPVSGAMDRLALCLANRLVGSPDSSAALEITVQGPELLFECDVVLAIAGADLSPMINGQPVPNWTTFAVKGGDTLTFGPRRSGARAYVSMAGGLDVTPVLGSRSTHVRSRTGGLDGRALVDGDRLGGGRPPTNAHELVGCSVPEPGRPVYTSSPTLRAVLGPQSEHFTSSALRTLVSGRYIVSPQSDRMGYRLEGPPLTHARAPDIISDATPFGAVQVPANQQPLLLMADRQTTGGYPKIAVVTSADLPLAAQLMPGDAIMFSLVDCTQARLQARRQQAALDAALPPVRNSVP